MRETRISGNASARSGEVVGRGFFPGLVAVIAATRTAATAARGGDSVAGMPLTAGDGILYAPDMAALAGVCLAAMDDFALLNRLQNNAFAAVEDAFDWDSRGRILIGAIGAARSLRQPAETQEAPLP